MDHAARSPKDVDRQLGLAIRDRRRALSVTQEDLAARCGVSFQQIQKYESGANRISFSRLVQIARALGCMVNDLASAFDEADERPPVTSEYERFVPLPDAKRLLVLYAALPFRAREALINLLDVVADDRSNSDGGAS